MLNEGRNTFPPACRLRRAGEFRGVMRDGKVLHCRGFKVMLAPNPAGPRLGLVVGKRSFKRAVQRNWVKRMQREHFRQIRSSLPGVDVVVVSRWGLEKQPRDEVAKMVKRVWLRLADVLEAPEWSPGGSLV